LRTPSETLDFVTTLLINDLNMLTVDLRHGTARTMDAMDKRISVIKISFKGDSELNWLDTLNTELKGFLHGQNFLVSNCDSNILIIALFF